jgi:sigma-E factor negative regulatory protein RseC
MNNSGKTATVTHFGIVQKVENNVAIVAISSASACSECHAGKSCTLSGREEKIIKVTGTYNVRPGDPVNIIMEQSMGYTALLFGYLFPLMSVVSVLIVLVSINMAELYAGLISLSILIPYYILLYLFRKQINKKFTFTLKPV